MVAYCLSGVQDTTVRILRSGLYDLESVTLFECKFNSKHEFTLGLHISTVLYTLHSGDSDRNSAQLIAPLKCDHCAFHERPRNVCPRMRSAPLSLLVEGGTEQLE